MSKIISLRGDLRTGRPSGCCPGSSTVRWRSMSRTPLRPTWPNAPECRAELAEERALSAAVASLPVDPEQDFASIRARVVAQTPPAIRTRPARRDAGRIFHRPISLGWAIAAQARGSGPGHRRGQSAEARAPGLLPHPELGPAGRHGQSPGDLQPRPDRTGHADLADRHESLGWSMGRASATPGSCASMTRPGRQALATLKADKRVLLAEAVDAGRWNKPTASRRAVGRPDDGKLLALAGAATRAVADEPANIQAVPQSRQILVMLKLMPDHLRGQPGYGADYGSGLAAEQRRSHAQQIARRHHLTLIDGWLWRCRF